MTMNLEENPQKQTFDFKFNTNSAIVDLIERMKNGSNQLLFLQMNEGDSFYGSCMVNQELNSKASGQFLFLSSTESLAKIGNGLETFLMEENLKFLIFVENLSKQFHHKNQIVNILNSNQSKRALIITNQFNSELTVNTKDENLLTLPAVKVSDLTQESLDKFLEKKEVKLQDEIVTLKSILGSSDQSFIDTEPLIELDKLEFISHNVLSGKNYDPDLYIPRKLLKRNIIQKDILTRIKEAAGNKEKIVANETEFNYCCKHFPDANVHLLKPQIDGFNLVWRKSKGRIDFLLDYVSSEQGTPIQNPWVSQATADSKVFVLSDVPGMGKTFWMNHLVQNLKEMNKNHLIVNMNFNDHMQYFENHRFENEESVLKFLESKELRLRGHIEKFLFRIACTKTKNVQLIFDGLDEVCPEHEQKMFELIEIVHRMGLTIYISTRPELKRELEVKLQIFCHELLPFTEEDQLNFLIKFWSRREPGYLSDDDLRDVAEKAILSARKNKLIEITGIPLITRMVAESFDSNLISKAVQDEVVLGKIFKNISHLYDIFVDKNIERYLVEKLYIDVSIRGNRRIVKSEKQQLIIFYKKMAAKLSLHQHLELFENFELTPDDLEEMRKCGLMYSGTNIKFIDTTFTDYFAHLTIKDNFNDEKVANFLIQKVFCEDKFVMLRFFLNSSIQEVKVDLKLYGKILLEFEDEFQKSAKIACNENNEHLFDIIMKSFLAYQPKIAT